MGWFGCSKKANDSSGNGAPMPKLVFQVPDMHCPCKGCDKKIKSGLKELNGVQSIEVDFPSKQVTVFGNADIEIVNSKLGKITKKTVELISSQPMTPPPAPVPAPPPISTPTPPPMPSSPTLSPMALPMRVPTPEPRPAPAPEPRPALREGIVYEADQGQGRGYPYYGHGYGYNASGSGYYGYNTGGDGQASGSGYGYGYNTMEYGQWPSYHAKPIQYDEENQAQCSIM